MHFDPNLTAIAIVFSVALLCGLILMRFKQPAIIGYIVAGVILGPAGFQIIEETEAAKTLAELGVLLLLFLIFSKDVLKNVNLLLEQPLHPRAWHILFDICLCQTLLHSS